MKKHILKLIQDDIKITRLVHILQEVNISASALYLANSSVIFSFMGIDENEENTETYCKLIERAADNSNLYRNPKKIKDFAQEVYEFLLSLENCS